MFSGTLAANRYIRVCLKRLVRKRNCEKVRGAVNNLGLRGRRGYFDIPEQGHWSSSLSLGTGNMETSLSSVCQRDNRTLEVEVSTGF